MEDVIFPNVTIQKPLAKNISPDNLGDGPRCLCVRLKMVK